MLKNEIMGAIIRDGRTKKGLSQQELGDLLGVTKAAVSNWENGKNRIDEEIKENIEKTLNVSLKEVRLDSTPCKLALKPLIEHDNLSDLVASVDDIINQVPLDTSNAVTIKSMLKKSLMAIIGYELYFLDYSEIRPDWDSISQDIDDLISDEKRFCCDTIIEKYDNLLKSKLHHIGFQIGYKLFEDFDEDGYRNGYLQQVAHYGQDSSDDLVNVLPEIDNSLVTSYKIALCNLADILCLQDTLEI